MPDTCRNNLDNSWNFLTFEPDRIYHNELDDFKINYAGSGWYETENGWMFIQEVNNVPYGYFWNFDPRPLLRNILESEVRT